MLQLIGVLIQLLAMEQPDPRWPCSMQSKESREGAPLGRLGGLHVVGQMDLVLTARLC